MVGMRVQEVETSVNEANVTEDYNSNVSVQVGERMDGKKERV